MGYQRRKAAGEKPALPNLKRSSRRHDPEGAIVIDVAINRIPAGFDEKGEPIKNDAARTRSSPLGTWTRRRDGEGLRRHAVPGGVGPVTVAMLLRNTVACAKAMT